MTNKHEEFPTIHHNCEEMDEFDAFIEVKKAVYYALDDKENPNKEAYRWYVQVESRGDYAPINFCPWCGVKLEYV